MIILSKPANGISVSGLVTFGWAWAGELGDGETFDIKVCKGEGCQPRYGIANTRETTWSNWCPTEGEGAYHWLAEVIDETTKQPKGPMSEVWEFTWHGGCGGPPPGPSPTSTPR